MQESHEGSTPIFDGLMQQRSPFAENMQPTIDTNVDPLIGGAALEVVEQSKPEAPNNIVVGGWLTKTAEDLVQEINQAIADGKTSVGLDPFITIVDRKAYEGFVTHTEASRIKSGIIVYEQKLNNHRKLAG